MAKSYPRRLVGPLESRHCCLPAPHVSRPAGETFGAKPPGRDLAKGSPSTATRRRVGRLAPRRDANTGARMAITLRFQPGTINWIAPLYFSSRATGEVPRLASRIPKCPVLWFTMPLGLDRQGQWRRLCRCLTRHGWEHLADLLDERNQGGAQGELGQPLPPATPPLRWTQVDVGGPARRTRARLRRGLPRPGVVAAARPAHAVARDTTNHPGVAVEVDFIRLK